MDELVVRRWRRGGNDRLYVNRGGPQGVSVAWHDLRSGETKIIDSALAAEAELAIASWITDNIEQAKPHPSPLPLPPLIPPVTSDNDLSLNRPGASVERKIREIESAYPPPLRWLARMLGYPRSARSWRTGLVGERIVGDSLDGLADEGWYVLHAIEWPTGSDIDHLVIGPPGVFTINAKHHARARIWVGDHVLRVNNHNTHHLRNSIAEAERVGRVLRRWCGWEAPVVPVVAVVGARGIVMGGKEPSRALVVDGRHVDRYLRGLPPVATPSRLAAVYEVARRRDVWSAPSRRS